MKAVTLWPELAVAILYLNKRVDNRSWAAPRGLLGQRIALHMGARYHGTNERCLKRYYDRIISNASSAGYTMRLWIDRTGNSPVWRGFHVFEGESTVGRLVDVKQLPTMAIIATAVVRSSSFLYAGSAEYCNGTKATPWSLPGTYGWQWDDLRVLDDPIPTKGARGVWTVPDDIERAICVTQKVRNLG